MFHLLNQGIQTLNRAFASYDLSRAFLRPKKMLDAKPMRTERPITIFYHVCTIKNWKKIVTEQMECLVNSGLLEKAETLFIGSNGPNSTNELTVFLKDHTYIAKIVFLQLQENIPNENETINYMTKFARSHINTNILYIHTKGVTERNELQEPWRDYMMRLVVKNHERCLSTLEYFKTVGPLYLKRPYRHYSGNFFWARSEYVASLDLITNLDNRYNAEKHILSKYSQTHHAAIGKSWYFMKAGPLGITKSIFNSLDEFEYII
jgi:hypothetical protein